MLKYLTLKDFAVVSAVELAFEAGMTAVSGETGAGKSLLVDALLTLTGSRADTGMVRHGAQRAELSAEFDLGDAPEAAAWLGLNDLDDGAACQLRRTIRTDGASRSWINGRPATLSQLAQLGAFLVEIHGQHEHQALLDRLQQLRLLDAFARHPALLADTSAAAADWAQADRELAEISRTGDVADRVSSLEHQLQELAREQLDPADIERMLVDHRRQTHAVALLDGYDQALMRLSGGDQGGIGRSLRQVAGELGRHQQHEPRLLEALALLDSAEIQLDELSNLLERLRDALDLDPARLEAIEARLARLHELSRRHRIPMEQLEQRELQLCSELETLRGLGERSERLVMLRAGARLRWQGAATRLSQSRKSAGEKLAAAVSSLMAELGMGGGVFAVELQTAPETAPVSAGADRCDFLVSTNAGQPPRPLRKVASGGELARISLAIEVALFGLDPVPTMIFDEVDSGIGGAVAEVVGQKLRSLGARTQVLCVTHLPQVAAQGHNHFQVSKSNVGDQTHSAVARLDDKQRIEELARMLGGVEISKESRANARQMLSRAQA